ncbi:DGQHR domain-containing protein [Phyllobacterium ifriqiyense]|uniref:DGQHR domain-containing protein n=1 Tax=Phyllobacterium ifriqiyense TaxID=314238 RepID=A0ABU0S5P9_9HYPH|nr:DGQHR domain-containing protein [Phyllobacterium ifriqiyense]MDQ0996082.1 DGQHR domain-containing protein [Phyllobacterium ifriqiyense]
MQYEYDAFVFQQRADGSGPLFAMFQAPAGEVDAWADVDRLGPDNKLGPQREPKKSRISSIKRFFADDPNNTIPTAIVVGLKGVVVEVQGNISKIKFEAVVDQPKPGLIIDGQHRLRGLQAVSDATFVPIVAILEATDLEMAFQFLVINNKSARVPPDHIRALALNYSQDQLETRLRTARLSQNPNLGSVGVLDEDDESPFRGIVDWPNNPADSRIIAPSAVESMAAEVRSLGFGELEDLDSVNAFLIAMWSVIKEEWPNLFVKGSKLMSKVGLICITQFVCTTMKTWARNPHLRTQVDPGDPDKVRNVTRDVLNTLSPRFFEADWTSTSYDTRAGRDQIMNDLEALSFNVANSEHWYEGLKIIDRNWLQVHLSDHAGATPPVDAV